MAIWIIVALIAALLIGYVMKKMFGFKIGKHFFKNSTKRGIPKDELEVKEASDDNGSQLDEPDTTSPLETHDLPKSSQTAEPELLALINDPALQGFWSFMLKRKKKVTWFLEWVAKTEIWLGVSAGLLGMSVFAISYDFWDGVVKNPNIYPAISYSIFFVFVVNGIYSYTSRKSEIERLNAELKSVNELHSKYVEDLNRQHNEEIAHYLKNLQKGETRSETVTEQNKSLHIRNEQLHAEIQKHLRTISRLESELSKFTSKKSRIIFWKKGN